MEIVTVGAYLSVPKKIVTDWYFILPLIDQLIVRLPKIRPSIP